MDASVHTASPTAPAQAQAVPLLRALVFCDLVDSTRLLERLGDQRGADLFRRHDRLVRALLHAHGAARSTRPMASSPCSNARPRPSRSRSPTPAQPAPAR